MFLFIIFSSLLVIHVLGQAGVSYPKDQCDWIGADGMHGAYLPIGVCKHIFDPKDLATPTDDHRYSQQYICDDGIVKTHGFANDSFCKGNDTPYVPVPIPSDDYFYCSGNGPCPYAVVRFHRQQAPESDECIKATDGWFSEAPMTTYQCLNITKNGINEWYMLKCTQDGKGLIGVDYTANCQEKLNESVIYDGCNYKDLWVEIRHCDYWDEINPINRDTSTSTSTSTATPDMSTSQASVTGSNILSTIISQTVSTENQRVDSVSDSDEYHRSHSHEHNHGSHGHSHGYHNHRHRHGSHSHEHSHEHEHDHEHGSHSHDKNGYGHDNDHYETDSQEMNKQSNISWPVWFIVAAGVGVLFMILCCCITYKYMKQKREIATFAKIVEYTVDIEGNNDDDINDKDNTINVDEGETVTFK